MICKIQSSHIVNGLEDFGCGSFGAEYWAQMGRGVSDRKRANHHTEKHLQNMADIKKEKLFTGQPTYYFS